MNIQCPYCQAEHIEIYCDKCGDYFGVGQMIINDSEAVVPRIAALEAELAAAVTAERQRVLKLVDAKIAQMQFLEATGMRCILEGVRAAIESGEGVADNDPEAK